MRTVNEKRAAQEFIVIGFTRQDVAVQLNDQMWEAPPEGYEAVGDGLHVDDRRLTNALLKRHADALASGYEDGMSEDALFELERDALITLALAVGLIRETPKG